MFNQQDNDNISTKEKLIETSLELFALYGYEGVSTRQIVNKAGVNISAINYYFGGKKGLYNAAIESKVKLFEEKILADLQQVHTLKLTDKDEQKKFFVLLIEKYMNFIFSRGVPQYVMMLMVREINRPSETFNIIYKRIMYKASKAFTDLLCAIFDRPEDDEEIMILVATLIGQILIFRISKNLILKRLERNDYDQDLIDKIKKTILNQVNSTLTNWRPL